MDYSFGCGPEFSPDIVRRADAMPKFFTEEQVEYFSTQPFTGEVWCEYLRASGCTAVFLDQWNDAFAADYGGLFTDGLQSGARLYRIEEDGAGMRFVPAGGEEAAS